MRSVLITGGTGFIGSSLAVALLDRGVRVRILRRPQSDLRAVGKAEVEHVVEDVRDIQSLRNAINGCDTVFHTAAVISHWRKERPLMYNVNIGGTRNVANACLELGVEKLVHTSSVAAVGYNPDGLLADETTQFNWEPFDIGYRISKYRAEEEIVRAAGLGLPVVILNPSTVIGPRDIHFHGGKIIKDVHRKRIFYFTDGGMNIVYIDDVVRGHLAAAEVGKPGERYILAGENLTYREIFQTTAEVVGGIRPLFRISRLGVKTIASTIDILSAILNVRPWISRELVAGLEIHNWFTSAKAQRELKYSPTPFREAVGKTFTWYMQNGFL